MAEVQDDRTAEQKLTHKYVVCGTDTFMSGWGKARGGSSIAGWACRERDLPKVEAWVRSRSDMKRVRVAYDYRPRTSGTAKHVHIYVVDEGHNSLK